MLFIDKDYIITKKKTFIVERYNLIKLHNRFIMYNSKDDFQLTIKGVFGSWYYIIIEQIYTGLINILSRMEEKIQ